MDAIKNFADFVVKTKLSDIPNSVKKFDKGIILDLLGVLLAGTSAPGCREVVEVAKAMGGTPESTVLVYGGKLPAYLATFVNSTISQARDFDDTHDGAIVHTHCSCVPPAIAMAEALGKSGSDLLEAIILAAEVECRIGVCIYSPLSFVRTGALGYFGATTAVGKLMGLSVEELWNAYGIMYSQVSTTLQPILDGALVKRMHPGFASKAAVLSCLLAKKGLTGARNILEGTYGYLNLYEKGEYTREKMLDGLGDRWEVTNLSVKPYPCARDMHGALDVAVQMNREGLVHPEQIEKVLITMPRAAFDVSGKPYSSISGNIVVESILSGAYCTSVALNYGRVEIGNFTPESVNDPKVVELAKKTEVVMDPERPIKGLVPMTVKLTMKDGSEIERTSTILKGDPKNPLTPEEQQEKFNMCAKYSAIPFSAERLAGIADAVNNMEELKSVSELVELMTPGE